MKHDILTKSAIAAALMFGAASACVPAAYAAGQAGTSGSTATSTSGTASGSTAASGSATAKSVPAADKQFAMKAAQGGMAEVELGKLAQSNAQNEKVKAFGSRMVNDHSSANDKLKQIASKEGIQLPAKMDASAEKMLDKLRKLSGAQFDQAYMTHMVADHQKDIKEFEQESKQGRDSDLKQFATDTLPTLREHLTQAQEAKSAAMSDANASKPPKQASSSVPMGKAPTMAGSATK